MDCAEEVAVLKRELGPLVGGETNLSFDILNGKLTIGVSSGLSSAAIREAVGRTGMRAEVWRDDRPEALDGFWSRRGRSVLAVASAVVLAVLASSAKAELSSGIPGQGGLTLSPHTGKEAQALSARANLEFAGAGICAALGLGLGTSAVLLW